MALCFLRDEISRGPACRPAADCATLVGCLTGMAPCGRTHMMNDPAIRGGAVPDSDLMFRPASELASMVRTGEVSSRELVEISLERIEELNPQLNAFVQ